MLHSNSGGNTSIGIGASNIQEKLQVGESGDDTRAIANQWSTWSDKRLKGDFAIIDNPLEKLSQLNGYYYYWKGNGLLASSFQYHYLFYLRKGTTG